MNFKNQFIQVYLTQRSGVRKLAATWTKAVNLAKLMALFFLIYLFANCGNKVAGKSTVQKQKKIAVLPIVLLVGGIEKDMNLLSFFRQAFLAKGVQLISPEESNLRMKDETERVKRVLQTRSKEMIGKSAEELSKMFYDEMRLINNSLNIQLEIQEKDDSLMIYKANWINTVLPTNPNRMISSGKREINMTNMSYSIQENIASIVDSILYSKALR